MTVRLVEYEGTVAEDNEIFSLLMKVYVGEGFTDPAVARTNFAPAEVKKRGDLTLARSASGELLGMVICAQPENPFRQVAMPSEAEMQLLCLDPEMRGQGIGKALCVRFEEKARSLGYKKLVFSTQPQMLAAHQLYESLGYQRNPTRDWTRGDRYFLVYEKTITL